MTFSLNQIQASVIQRQRWSNVFAAIAVMAIVIAFIILVALFGQTAVAGNAETELAVFDVIR